MAKHDDAVLYLAFAMDCTGSMGSYIETARNNIRNIVEEIVSYEKIDVKLALVEYRDHPPEAKNFVTRTHDFTGSVQTMKSWLDVCTADEGGDAPEAVADALHDVLKLSWREEATKICVLISDAPPHGLMGSGDNFPGGCPLGLDCMAITRQLAEKGVTLYTVGCEPAITPYKDFFMSMAYLTGGQYVPLIAAKTLTQVIISGAQEELSLEKWMADVDAEVRREMAAGGEINEEELSKRVSEILKTKGAKGKQLMRNAKVLETASDQSKALSECSDMRSVKVSYNRTPSTSSPVSPSFSATSSTEDAYSVVESDVTETQAHRMVQKSKARNKKYFS